jgi:Ca-activated chloride channel family protein
MPNDHENDRESPQNDDSDHAAGSDGRHSSDQTPPAGVDLQLDPRPERHLLRSGGSSSYLDVVVRVAASPSSPRPERPPVHVALVIDRSGSMSGTKVGTAKQAALAVLDGLSDRDTAAVVVFDDQIDVVQAEAPVTGLVKAHVAAELAGIDARGSTALHEGWLVGCRAIAADSNESPVEARTTGVRRCFLLTDGQANVGLSQPEGLAQAAAQVREAAQVSTSTFGIGTDYDEELLGPMAVAGGGQFYHLRTSEEIATTFIGELEQLLGTLARDAHLEIEATPGVVVALVSAYAWQVGAPGPAGTGRWNATIGDLLGGEERHIVIALNFPAASAETHEHSTRVRLTWQDEDGSHASAWQPCRFRYAESAAEYDAEMRDETVLHYAAQHLSDRAQREAITARKRGDLASAQLATQTGVARLGALGLRESDDVLASERQSLADMQVDLSADQADPLLLKERYYQSQLRSRGKLDLRRSRPAGNENPTPPKDPKGGTPPTTGS